MKILLLLLILASCSSIKEENDHKEILSEDLQDQYINDEYHNYEYLEHP